MVSSHMVKGIRIIFEDGWTLQQKMEMLADWESGDFPTDRAVALVIRRYGHVWYHNKGDGVEGVPEAEVELKMPQNPFVDRSEYVPLRQEWNIGW